jgi:PAS domain S-box-containing protein
MQAMRDHLQGKTNVYDVTYRIKNKNGEYNWFKDKGGIVEKDENGKPKKVTGIVMDISREKQLEKEKENTYELVYQTLQYNPVASTIVNQDGRITFANKKAQELFGITQDQIQKRDFDDVNWEITDIEGNEIPSEQLPFSIIMKTQQPVNNYQHFIKIPKKEKKLLSINGAPMFNEEGTVNGIVFTLNDITKEKKAEEAIRKSEKRYRNLFNENRDAILVADTNRKIKDANPSLENLFGYQLKEIEGKKTSFLYADESVYKEMGEKLNKIQKNQGFFKLIPYKKKNGVMFYGETNAFSIKDEHGKIQSYVGLIRDVTEKIENDKKQKIWEHTINSISEGIVLLDEQYNILQYNEAFVEIVGVNKEKVESQKSYKLLHGTDSPPERCVTCKALSKKSTAANEYWEPHLQKYLRVTVDPVYKNNGEFDFLVEKIEDISNDKDHSKKNKK